MARRLAREEALFAGTSSGANVVAAIQVAQRVGPDAKVVTLMADSGLKYLSTDVYRADRTLLPLASAVPTTQYPALSIQHSALPAADCLLPTVYCLLFLAWWA